MSTSTDTTVATLSHFTAREAREMLHCSKDTLYRWVKEGKLKRYEQGARKFLYDRVDVFRMGGIRPVGMNENVVIYCRVVQRSVATTGDMDEQVLRVTDWCLKNGMQVNGTYKDVCYSLDFRKHTRPGFHQMLGDVMARKIDCIVMESSDRLARFGYEMFAEICARYKVKLVFMNETPVNMRYKDEVKEELRRAIEDIKAMYDNRASSGVRERVVETDGPEKV